MAHGESKLKRKYSDKTLKILFALSGNECAEPNCHQTIIKQPTAESAALVVGQIAHIYALNVDGPRGKAALSEAELNGVSNLILLCPTHHVVVDGQHETYPAQTLIEWKKNHEKRFSGALSASISDVGFAELEVAAKALASMAPVDDDNYKLISPNAKIAKNDLGISSAMLLHMGAAKSKEVAAVLVQAAQLDPGFAERLKAGFVNRYKAAKETELSGDQLFAEVYDWATGGSTELLRTASGICILAHLFIICDVFEK